MTKLIVRTTFTRRAPKRNTTMDGKPKWWLNRLPSYIGFLKSIRNQEYKDFELWVTFPKGFDDLSKSLIEATEEFDGVAIRKEAERPPHLDYIPIMRRYMGYKVVEFLMDSDDWLHRKALKVLMDRKIKTGRTYILNRGYVYNTTKKILMEYNPKQPYYFVGFAYRGSFLGNIEDYDRFRNIHKMNQFHGNLDKTRHPVIVNGRLFCHIIHTANLQSTKVDKWQYVLNKIPNKVSIPLTKLKEFGQ